MDGSGRVCQLTINLIEKYCPTIECGKRTVGTVYCFMFLCFTCSFMHKNTFSQVKIGHAIQFVRRVKHRRQAFFRRKKIG